MSWSVKFEAQQTILDPVTGEVVLEVGELLDPSDKLAQAEPRAFKPVAVEDEKKGAGTGARKNETPTGPPSSPLARSST